MDKFVVSIKKNIKGIALMTIAALLTAVGQLLWKISNGVDLKWIIIGFVCYGLGAVLMIIALRFGSLSVIHPMLSFGYVFAIFLGLIVLKEHISTTQLLAIGIIITGVVFIGGGDV